MVEIGIGGKSTPFFVLRWCDCAGAVADDATRFIPARPNTQHVKPDGALEVPIKAVLIYTAISTAFVT